MKNYRDLEIYQLSYRLGLEIHRASLNFPKSELYELGTQIRRSPKAIAANIAEDFGRKTLNQFRHFLTYALASTDETRVHLDYAYDLKYLSNHPLTNCTVFSTVNIQIYWTLANFQERH